MSKKVKLNKVEICIKRIVLFVELEKNVGFRSLEDEENGTKDGDIKAIIFLFFILLLSCVP